MGFLKGRMNTATFGQTKMVIPYLIAYRMFFQPMSANTTLSQDLASTLRTEILRDRYHAGDRLPSERELSVRFGINRGAVREALKQLEQLGIISIQPGGARVKPKEEATLEILGHIMTLNEYPDPNLVDQFLLVFKALMLLSAKNAVQNANEDQLKSIAELIENVKKEISSDEPLHEAWSDFFMYILVISDNLVLRLVMNGLKNQFLQRMMNFEVKPTFDAVKMRAIALKLEEAFQQKDAAKVELAVTDYFEQMRNVISELLASVKGKKV